MHKTHEKLKWQHGVPHTDCTNVGSRDEYIDIDFNTHHHIYNTVFGKELQPKTICKTLKGTARMFSNHIVDHV